MLIICSLPGAAQNTPWIKTLKDNPGYLIRSCAEAVDDSGNVYTAGYYTGTVDMDPGPGTYNLSPVGARDVYVLKLDRNGNFMWAKSLGGTSDEDLSSLALDASGYVYFSGTFRFTADLDPGPGVYMATGPTTTMLRRQGFFEKLDRNGNFIWAKVFEANDQASISYLSFKNGSMYAFGGYLDSVDLDLGPGTYRRKASVDGSNFMMKMDTAAQLIWVKTMIKISFQSLAFDAKTNFYIGGTFSLTGDFDMGPGVYNMTSAGNQDAFVLKLDSNANFIWAKRMGGTMIESGNSIALDDSMNIYIGGDLEGGTANFDPGISNYTILSAGNMDAYIAKFDSAGHFIWVKGFGSSSYEHLPYLTADGPGNIYATGYFSNTVDFDPGPGIYNMVSVGSTDVFLLKLDRNGQFVWAGKIGSTDDDQGNMIILGASGNIYTTGFVAAGTVDFDPGIGTYNMTIVSQGDAYIAKYNNAGVLPITLLHFDVTRKDRFAQLSWQTSSEINTHHFSIERSADGAQYTAIGEVRAAGNSNRLQSYTFTDEHAAEAAAGRNVYYRFKTVDMDGTSGYSPVREIAFTQALAGISFYPNPAGDLFVIQASAAQTGTAYQVTDITGAILVTGTLQGELTSIDVHALAPGMYFIQAGDAKAQKLLKQ